MFGNGMRPQIWQEFVDRFKIPLIAELYGATEGISNIGMTTLIRSNLNRLTFKKKMFQSTSRALSAPSDSSLGSYRASTRWLWFEWTKMESPSALRTDCASAASPTNQACSLVWCRKATPSATLTDTPIRTPPRRKWLTTSSARGIPLSSPATFLSWTNWATCTSRIEQVTPSAGGERTCPPPKWRPSSATSPDWRTASSTELRYFHFFRESRPILKWNVKI